MRSRRRSLMLYGGSSGPDAAAAAAAVIAAMSTPPSGARATLITNLVSSLVTAGIWAKLDALWVTAAADSQAAKINWILPGTYNLTETNAPAFVANMGFTGASTKYLDTNFNPTTAVSPKYSRDSATIFAWSQTAAQDAGAIYGGPSGTNVELYPRYTDDLGYFQVNNSSDGTASVATGAGLTSLSRSSSSTFKSYRNGAVLGTHSINSTAPDNSNHYLLRRTADYYTGQVAVAGCGGALTDGENTALYNALNTYMVGVSYSAEATALFAAMSVQPDDTRKALIDACIVSLKSNGIWSLLDALYVMAAHDAQAARVNWKNPGTFDLSLVSTPTFTTDRGYAGNGTDQALNTGYTPSTAAGVLTQNSAALSFWSRTTGNAATNEIGVIDTGTNLGLHMIIADTTGGQQKGRLNTTTQTMFNTPAAATGLFSIVRTAAGAVAAYRNGSAAGTGATASSALPSSGAVRVLGRAGSGTNQWSARQGAAAAIGAARDATQESNFYNALQTYMTAVGA